MKRRTLAILTILASLSIGLTAVVGMQQASVAQPTSNPADVETVRQALHRIYTIEAGVVRSLDLSQLQTAFASDARAEPLTANTTRYVYDLLPELDGKPVGWLDYKMAFYTQRKRGIEGYEALQRQAAREGRAVTSQELNSLIENNRGSPPVQREKSPIPTTWDFKIESASITGDVARARIDFPPRVREITLIKKDGVWLYSGEKTITFAP
jgi:hypothetical protein